MTTRRTFATAILVLMSATSVSAQTVTDFDGLYYPTGTTGWSCNPDHIGMDGGALSIGDGYLDGVENRCELTNPQPASNGVGIMFTALCSGEGESYSDPVQITKTDAGVTINRNDRVAAWTACPAASQGVSEPPVVYERWVFADGVASIRSDGNYLEFSCTPAGPSATIPTARMYACPLCWMGDEIKFGFSVDGAAPETFTFTKQSNAEGMTSDLYAYPAWRKGIIPQLISGRKLTVFEGGTAIASYPLNGSSAALEALRFQCN